MIKEKEREDHFLEWEAATAPTTPASLDANVFETCVTPKPVVWVSVDEESVALVEGYGVATFAPPVLILGTDLLPKSIVDGLKRKQLVTLSMATVDHQKSLAIASNTSPTAFPFADLSLEKVNGKGAWPSAVAGSPMRMFGRTMEIIDLGPPSDVPYEEHQEVILITVDYIQVSGSALSKPLDGPRETLAKIDAQLMRPVASVGNGRFATITDVHSMYRPRKSSKDSETFVSQPFVRSPSTSGPLGLNGIEYSYIDDTGVNLGYNPTKAIVLPRPIGWISTYRDNESKLPHVAPYSFFCEVGRGERPMVAFSSYTSTPDSKKDAQLDAETMGCFCANICSIDLAVAMNYTAAPLKQTESEFHLSSLKHKQAKCVNAPYVASSPIIMECKYVKTIHIPSWSIVIGEVVCLRIREDALGTDGLVDIEKVKPVSRMGYLDEYAVIDRYLVDADSKDSGETFACFARTA